MLQCLDGQLQEAMNVLFAVMGVIATTEALAVRTLAALPEQITNTFTHTISNDNMKNIAAIKKQNQEIRGRQSEAPIVPYKGRYGFDSHITMKACFFAGFTEEMFAALVEYSELCPDRKVLELLERYNQFLLQNERANATGEYIEDAGQVKAVRAWKPEKGTELPERIFGMTWDELEKKQGGKISS